jgi:hypothetical protein
MVITPASDPRMVFLRNRRLIPSQLDSLFQDSFVWDERSTSNARLGNWSEDEKKTVQSGRP